MSEQKQIEELKKLLPGKRGKRSYAERLGVPIEEIERLIKKVKYDLEDIEEGLEIEGETRKYNLDKGTLEVSAVYSFPPDPQTVIKDHRIDEKEYQLSAYYSKGHKNGKYTATALFRKISKEVTALNDFKDFLKSYKPIFKDSKVKNINKDFEDKACLLLSLCDFHLGKLDINTIPVEERVKQYHETVDTLLAKSFYSHNLEEIIYVIGNDMFQTDSVLGKTVKETKVSESMTWDKAYEIGYTLLADTISKLSQYCNKLKIVHIPGNHSESKEYYVAHALEVLFKGNKNITFDRTSDKYKCHVYGETAIFLSHGDTIQDKLPLMFAQSFRKEWGQTKYHEICLGDRHHNSEKRIITSQGESQGVRMRILPALTALDKWHYDNLYTNAIQAGIALIYDREKGKCAEFEHRI